jgi:hypothetical protein
MRESARLVTATRRDHDPAVRRYKISAGEVAASVYQDGGALLYIWQRNIVDTHHVDVLAATATTGNQPSEHTDRRIEPGRNWSLRRRCSWP